MRFPLGVAMIAMLLMTTTRNAWAVDSYRYLHVTIDTPWIIFVFLFFLVFAPMILAVILYWRNALQDRKEAEESKGEEGQDA